MAAQGTLPDHAALSLHSFVFYAHFGHHTSVSKKQKPKSKYIWGLPLNYGLGPFVPILIVGTCAGF